MHVDSGAPRPVEVPAGRGLAWLGALSALLLAGMLAAVVIGTYRISFADVLRVVAARLGSGGADDGVSAAVIWNLRIPRVLLAALVGAALASSGAVFQASFRNPLVEPYILGVSSGAAFGAALGMVAPHFPLSVPLAAFVGGAEGASMTLTNLPARADSVYQSVVARDSTLSDARFALNELGKMRFAGKDWSGALGYFQRRIALDPNNGEAYYFSGLSYKQMDQTEPAVAALRQAAVLDSMKADRHFWLGVVLDAQKDATGARAAFGRAVSLDSTSKLMSKAYSQLGYYALLEREWTLAVDHLEHAVAIDPIDLQSLVWLGQAYQNSGNCAKALGAYRRALAINPAQPDALKGVKTCSGGGASASKGGGE